MKWDFDEARIENNKHEKLAAEAAEMEGKPRPNWEDEDDLEYESRVEAEWEAMYQDVLAAEEKWGESPANE